ncbi:MGMT family protein [Candidatus Woesearchaeota archaeon]|nr:MGMT family protein [Candidatus Woesearchaeota archaeon]
MGFSERVYNATKKIPKGKVSTYKDIAKMLNCKAYRAVGNALNNNCSKDVPCHRVIKSNGFVGGFNHGIKKKILLLKKEKIKVKNSRVNLVKYLFKF